MNTTISLSVLEKEWNIFKSYTKYKNSTLAEIIRSSILEKFEYEYDLKVFEE